MFTLYHLSSWERPILVEVNAALRMPDLGSSPYCDFVQYSRWSSRGEYDGHITEGIKCLALQEAMWNIDTLVINNYCDTEVAGCGHLSCIVTYIAGQTLYLDLIFRSSKCKNVCAIEVTLLNLQWIHSIYETHIHKVDRTKGVCTIVYEMYNYEYKRFL